MSLNLLTLFEKAIPDRDQRARGVGVERETVVITNCRYNLCSNYKGVMVKYVFLIISGLIFSISCKAEFSCDQIKDDAVRAACSADRQQSSSANPQAGRYQKFMDDAKSVMTTNFKDPGSAQWRHLFISEIKNNDLTTWFLCGEVNAKNSYGAYIGFKAFIADKESGYMQGDEIFKFISTKACTNAIYVDSTGESKEKGKLE